MALYLPVRPISRSQALRVGQPPSAVYLKSQTTTYYVDISNGTVRRDLMHHLAIGAVVVVGALSANNVDVDVASGAVVVAGTAANSVRVADPLTTTKTSGTAGELRVASTGVYVTIPVTDSIAITANALGFTRTDLVVVDNATGVGTIVVGTTLGVAPATPAGKTGIATFTVANGTSTLGPITDVRPRP